MTRRGNKSRLSGQDLKELSPKDRKRVKLLDPVLGLRDWWRSVSFKYRDLCRTEADADEAIALAPAFSVELSGPGS